MIIHTGNSHSGVLPLHDGQNSSLFSTFTWVILLDVPIMFSLDMFVEIFNFNGAVPVIVPSLRDLINLDIFHIVIFRRPTLLAFCENVR